MFMQWRRMVRVMSMFVVAAMAWRGAPAAGQLRVVTYNVAQLHGSLDALGEVLAATVVDHKPGFAVAPAAFVFQEVRGADINALEALVHALEPPGVTYVRGTYTTSAFEDGNGGAQALFYRDDLLAEVVLEHQDLVTGAGRLSDRWKLQLAAYPTSAASFYLYSSHLRAGDGASDYDDRVAGVTALRANADALPQGTHVIFAGDMNFQSSSEQAYLLFFAPGNATVVDPLGTGSWAGVANAIKHSQSPREVTTPQLTGGGMDDRFDFQLPTEEFSDGIDLTIMTVPFACRSFGNDAVHYNQAINLGNNFYYPGDLASSNALADALFAASDHVPVIVDYRLPALLGASMPANFGRVIVDGAATLPVTVSNLAPAAVPVGADALAYVVTGMGGLLGTSSGSVAALAAPAIVPAAINTSTVGVIMGDAVVTATGPMAGGPLSLHTIGTVLRHANPSFAGAADLDAITIARTFGADSGTQAIYVPLFNLGFDPLQARLDVDGFTAITPPLTLVDGVQHGLGLQPGVLTFAFDTDGLGPGTYISNVGVQVSDEDLPGAISSILALTLQVDIDGSEPIPADLDGDGHVTGLDLALLLGAWTGTSAYAPCLPFAPADLNQDCRVNGLDLALLLGDWG